MPSAATLRARSAVRTAGLRNRNQELFKRRATSILRFLLTEPPQLAAFESADRMSALGVDRECG